MLKNTKTIIIPFLIGLLAFLGVASTGFSPVNHALAATSSSNDCTYTKFGPLDKNGKPCTLPDCSQQKLSTACNDKCNPQSPNYDKSLCTSIVTNYIDPIVQFVAAGIGIIIVIMIVVGGIQYAISGGDPQATAAAKGRIVNALIALVAWGLMYALLQWLVPGGIF